MAKRSIENTRRSEPDPNDIVGVFGTRLKAARVKLGVTQTQLAERAGLVQQLAQELEKRLGDATVNVVTQNRPRWFSWLKPDKQHEAEHPHRRPLLLTQEVLQMPVDAEIILRPGMKPVRARKIQWWREPVFQASVHAPPEIPQLSVDIAMDDGSTEIVRKTARAMSGIAEADL